MITLNESSYKLCLLDTNAVSEMVNQPLLLGRFLRWSLASQPSFVPCFSLFTVLELRRAVEVYRRFTERFAQVPCLLLKSHEQLLEEEIGVYPDPTSVSPVLLGFAGPLASGGNDLVRVLATSFGTDSILAQERMWSEGQDEVVQGIRSLVPNFPPRGKTYTLSELRTFVQISGFEQLVYRQPEFVNKMVRVQGEAVDVDAFPSLKASLYTVFYKFYTDPSRLPSRSDAFDIIIAAATPYVDAIFTEAHQAEVLRKTKRQDDFIRDLLVYTLRDLRQLATASGNPV